MFKSCFLLFKKNNSWYQRLVCLFAIAICYAVNSRAQTVNWQQLDEQTKAIDSICYNPKSANPQYLYYCLPPATPKKLKPAILFIHGGAWRGGKANVFYAYAAYFAQRGIVGVSIDYRLLKTKSDAIDNCIIDCKSAFRFVKANWKNWGIDTTKIIVCGESAGGHLAASITMFDDYNAVEDNLAIRIQPAALVLLNPVVNLTTSVFLKFAKAEVLFANPPISDSVQVRQLCFEQAHKISPLFHVQKKLPTTLIINGTEDKVTPAIWANAFADSIKRKNTIVEVEWLPGKGHAFAVPHYKSTEEEVVNTALRIDQFLCNYGFLKGKPNLINANAANWIPKK